MNTIRYGLAMGRTVSIVTICYFVLVLLLPLGIHLIRSRTASRPAAGRPSRTLVTPFIGVYLLSVGGIAIGCFLFAPRAILIRSDGIVIDRMLSPVLLPWDQIRAIREVTPEEFSGTVRAFGNGGLFGRVGTYRSENLGTFRMYLTNEAEAVLVDAHGRFVISPHPPEPFVADAIRALALHRERSRASPGKPPA